VGEGALRASWHAFDAGRRDFRRVVAGSALAHALLLAFFIWAPKPQGEVMLPGVVEVDLLAAPAPPAPAKARAAAPKPPTPKTVVLPKEAAEPKRVQAKPEPKAQKSLEEVMKQLEKQDDLDDLEPAPQQVAKAAPGAGAAAGRGVRVDPAVAGWMRRARIHVRQSWVLAPGFRAEDLETHVRVELDASGRVVGEPEITRRSGNPWYDDSVVRALVKASPLPAPPEAGEWPFVFRPEEIL
jgi:colicin import membrane protein